MSEKPSNVPEATMKPSSADVAALPAPANTGSLHISVAQSKPTIPGPPTVHSTTGVSISIVDPKQVSKSAEPTTSAQVAAISVETVRSGVKISRADHLTEEHIVKQAEINQFHSDYGILRDYGIQSWKDQLLESQLLNYERLMAMSRRSGVSLADSQEE